MALWSSGAAWSSAVFWGPSSPVGPTFENNKKKHTKMQRQPYYPRPLGERSEWHTNLATKLPGYMTQLDLTQAELDSAVADNLTLAYGLGGWIVSIREHATSCTASLDTLSFGTDSANYVFPEAQIPPLPTLPAGITGIKPGALQRIFDLVQGFKHKPGYTEAIGLDLGIIGEEDTAAHARPEFTLKTEAGDGCHCVKVRFKKFGHTAVAVYSRRGSGGWELLGTPEISPYEDDRPLLVAGQPEIREYKLRFRDNGIENGDWTDVASITVSP